MAETARLIVNIDVPDLATGEAFYTAAFDLTVGRRFGGGFVELVGLEAPLCLLENPAGSGRAPMVRDYARHWTPVHLDIAVDDLDRADARVVALGARREGAMRKEAFGRIATYGDPFGHGFCFIQFTPEGYDAIAA
jgi:predicted enzyme related to lactoylglutathione lyase